MNLHVRIMAHTVPDAFGIALTAMIVFTVEKSVFVANSLLQTQAPVAVFASDILNSFFFHRLAG